LPLVPSVRGKLVAVIFELSHCQKQTRRQSFSLRQRLCDFAGAVNEKLRDGAERAVL
jgi:hypothetical protein